MVWSLGHIKRLGYVLHRSGLYLGKSNTLLSHKMSRYHTKFYKVQKLLWYFSHMWQSTKTRNDVLRWAPKIPFCSIGRGSLYVRTASTDSLDYREGLNFSYRHSNISILTANGFSQDSKPLIWMPLAMARNNKGSSATVITPRVLMPAGGNFHARHR